MNTCFLRVLERVFKAILIVVISVGMVLGSVPFIPHTVNAAVGSSFTYDFTTLPMNTNYNTSWNPTSTSLTGWVPEWNYEGMKPEKGMRITANTSGATFQVINQAPSYTVNGEYIKLNFDVPEGGWYDVNLTYFKSLAGGICDILIDQSTVKTGHTFYSATATGNVTDTIKSGVKLYEGRHTITFKLTSTVKLASNNLYYAYYYLKSLQLTMVTGKTYRIDALPSNSNAVTTWDPTSTVNSGWNYEWNYAQAKPALGLKLVSSSLQLINRASTSAVNGEMLMMNFDVPESGTYNVKLTSWKDTAGGTVRIKLDDAVVKSSHSFYASSATTPATETLASGLSLTKGNHTIAFELASTVKLAVNGLYYGYLYLTDLQLELTQSTGTNCKTSSGYYTPERINAARQNIASYTWASDIRNTAVATADLYLAQGYDYLWNLVTPQSLPRGYAVNQSLGCLNCGTAINQYGNYPYLADTINAPWKLECPNCHMKFPTNDFASYYQSGLDQHGIFNPSLADRSLLVNTLYPEKGSTWGVDDGFGYVNGSGNKYTFVAYYNHWHEWYSSYSIHIILNAFRDAYIYTGDISYARAGIILLDRIADVYPSMDTSAYKKTDGFLNSDGSSGLGKVVGCIWETGLIRDFCRAYDAFYTAMDDSVIVNYLSNKNNTYNISTWKYSVSGIRQNIENGIIKQVYPNILNAKIHGNNGMHQAALTAAAVAWNTLPQTKQWIDFNLKSGGVLTGPYRITGGNLLASLVNDVDRDGNGNESSPEYNSYWLGTFLNTADMLVNYSLYPGADLYQNAKMKKMFYAQAKLIMNGNYSANIGDSGSTGKPITFVNKSNMVNAFAKYNDSYLAQVAYFLNGNQSAGLHESIFTANPEAVAANIQNVINTNGPLKITSNSQTGYGLSEIIDQNADGSNARDAWIYYGRTGGHGHRDALNLGMHAFGLDVLPELGYPEYADNTYPRTNEWEKHTISHNTVLVDKTRQPVITVGDPKHFDDGQRVKLFDIEAPDVYSQTSLYKRTTAMIKVDDVNSYAVDFFRVKGGTDHHFSFHAAEGPVTTTGLTLVPQKDSGGNYIGSYAGSTVPFGQRPSSDSIAGSSYSGPGFHWLKNVDRASTPGQLFSIDWDITDTWNVLPSPQDVHLRLTMLGSYNDVALADGIPPQNKIGNPESLKYVMVHKTGTNLDSLFTLVIEPYVSTRFIQSISAATVKYNGTAVTGNDVKAVKVVLTNGRTDYVVSALDTSKAYTVDDKFTFKGAFGVYSEVSGAAEYAYVNDGTQIGSLITNAVPRYTGTVTGFTNTLSSTNEITVNINEAGYVASNLVGRYIYINKDGVTNAVYRINGVRNQNGSSVTLDIGDITTIRSYKDSNDFTQGYVYDFANGAAFSIPLSAEVDQ